MWYKESQKMLDNEDIFPIRNFSDRNIVNAQIKSLQDISGMLNYCSRLVYQTQRGARSVVSQIMSNKKVSSFPVVIQILNEADKIALDSPSKFASLCNEAAFEVTRRVGKLIKLREDFTKGETNDPFKPKKGLF